MTGNMWNLKADVTRQTTNKTLQLTWQTNFDATLNHMFSAMNKVFDTVIERALSRVGCGHPKEAKRASRVCTHMNVWRFLLLSMPRFVLLLLLLGNKGSSMDILVLEHVVLQQLTHLCHNGPIYNLPPTLYVSLFATFLTQEEIKEGNA